jgi:alpha-mannosidase
MQLESPVFESMRLEANRVLLNYKIAPIGKGLAENSTISQVLTFSPDSPHIDFKTVVEWTQHNKLLKVAFPTSVRARLARFGIQFGHIQRPTHKNTDGDMAKFEAAGRWVDLSESSAGFSMCSTVKTGFDVHEGVIRMSLLKAPLQPDKWADYGTRKFSYRVVFHQGGFESSNIIALSDELIVPVVLAEYKQPVQPIGDDAIPATAEFVIVSNPNIVMETMKPAFDCDGFIIRMYEASGGWHKTKVTFPLLAGTDWEVGVVDLLERPANGTSLAKIGASQLMFELTFRAFELTTVLVRRKAHAAT